MNQEATNHYAFGPFHLDGDGRRMLLNDRPVHLTTKVFDILLLLVRNRGEVVAKEVFMREVWPDSFVEESNLTVCISMLRKALGEGQRGAKYIETVAGRGYRFVAKVQEVGARDDLKTGERNTAIESMAVLPLVNVGNDPGMEYFADGITESLINNLAQIPQLSVIAGNIAFRYKGQHLDAQRVGEELNVPAVLIGKILLLSDHLTISVELINVADGHLIWGERYSRHLADIFLVQEEMAQEISIKLRIKLSAGERERLAKRHTESTQAYHLYLKGRYALNKRTEEGLKKAIEYFKRAVEVDPDYALAYAGVADAYNMLSYRGMTSVKETIINVETAARKALEIDPTLAEPHATLGHVKSIGLWDWPGGEKEFKLAIELNPNYPDAHRWYGGLLRLMGRFDESLLELRRAQDLDPLSLAGNTSIGSYFYYTRQYDLAISQLQETLELDQSYFPANFFMGQSYERKGMYEEALAYFEKAILYSDSDPEALGYFGYTLARSGERARALELLDQLKSLSQQKYVELSALVMIYLGLGETDQAFEWMEKVYQERHNWLLVLNIEPKLDELRDDPRFISLLRRVGLPTLYD